MQSLLTPQDLAEYLNISIETIYSWTSMKQIPYYKVGRLVRFDLDEIDKWLAGRKQEVYKR